MSNSLNWSASCVSKFAKIYDHAKRYGRLYGGEPTYSSILSALEDYPKLKALFLSIPVGPYFKDRVYIALGTFVLEDCALPGCLNKSMPNSKYCSHTCAANDTKVRDKYKSTCRKRFGVDNTFKSEASKAKIKKTNLSRYGAEHPSQSPKLQARKVQTYLDHFGVDHPWKLREIREKAEQTYVDNYGVDNPSKALCVKEKKKDTCFSNFGVEHPQQSQAVRNKSIASCNARYGVDNVSQDPQILSRQQCSAFRVKPYVLGTRTVFVQGFEPYAIDYLLNKGISAKRISVSSDPGFLTFDYVFEKKRRVYIPDILIRRKHKPIVVEVKSLYTFVGSRRMLRMNQAKAKAVLSEGFDFRLLVMGRAGERLTVPENWPSLSYDELARILQ